MRGNSGSSAAVCVEKGRRLAFGSKPLPDSGPGATHRGAGVHEKGGNPEMAARKKKTRRGRKKATAKKATRKKARRRKA